MNSNLLTWGLAGLLLLSGAANVLLWQRAQSLNARSLELTALQSQVEQLQDQAAEIDQLRVDYEEMQKLRRDTVELARLRNEASKARAQGPELAKLQAQLVGLTEQLKTAREALANQQANMQAQVAESVESAVAANQVARAASIACVSNMKQIGLGLRIWSNDHDKVFPQVLSVLHNEINSPKIFTCPSDPLRNPVEDWAQFAPAAVSYQYLLPNVNETQVNPEQPMVSCPIHGHVGRADGSVLSGQSPTPAP